MRICVISDLHYKYVKPNAEDRENADLVLNFLEQARGKYDLMILNGDIFDLWFDWAYTVIKQYFPLLVKLYELKQSGCRLVMISGNHDFWFGDFLPDYLGLELCMEDFQIDADGKKIYVCHGDTHTVNDLRYQVFRRIIRMPLMKKLFSLLHPDLALGIGSQLSRSSRARKDPPHLRSRKNAGLLRFAGTMIRSGKADYVIMGHSHDPVVKEINGGLYANSGDWISNHSYLEILSGKLSVEHYLVNKENKA
ncbi:MAG: UDP-2,3-diacylglucosamine diphosphatase [Candidatus Cloacimonetes bacterium]|jgi:UDP-2,3-diacylglucosamine hydrolase|nr:UDP-2,3-diacylglucosamine diphosphatase [Candidatus Cloacimonadota bacterium]MCB5268619.1 UDP-2,3-diacylglucosamine diphosphatase [Candidatus Cloacimonadota bacterium]MCK9334454.1 UDP-2,3-diacylglucosamine diphosphatase [Candidatus Cloacimonadota bacterium]MDD2544243.1 UDP-2,3-diacylglucosamine diphosphatase [Candidatus Cloacimonadota bacterium]MDD2683174.1 UDP-2,3-diacylglucosamine diphosphatase [Candidatus Cloacimonadota bacterium]